MTHAHLVPAALWLKCSRQDATVARQTEELTAGGAQCAKLAGELAAATQRGDDLLLASSGGLTLMQPYLLNFGAIWGPITGQR